MRGTDALLHQNVKHIILFQNYKRFLSKCRLTIYAEIFYNFAALSSLSLSSHSSIFIMIINKQFPCLKESEFERN